MMKRGLDSRVEVRVGQWESMGVMSRSSISRGLVSKCALRRGPVIWSAVRGG